MPEVLLKTLRDLRRGFAGWGLGLVAYVALLAAVYPSIRDNAALNRMAKDYPEALKSFIGFGGEIDYTTAAGYLGIEVFSFMAPLLFVIAAVSAGSAALAGEEERGTLDLLLSLPVSRRRVAVEKAGALLTEIAGLGLVLGLSLWVGARAVGMHSSAGHLAAATLDVALLALAYGGIALLVGAATGRRGITVGLTAALAVAAYLVSSLASLVDALGPAQKLSPFYWYSATNPLRHGLDVIHPLLLVALAAAAVAAATAVFERRDLAA